MQGAKRERSTESLILVVEMIPSGQRLWVAPVDALDQDALDAALAMAGKDASDDDAYERWRAECFVDAEERAREPWEQWTTEQVADPPNGDLFRYVVVCASPE